MAKQGYKLVRIGGSTIAIIGLAEIFEEVKEQNIADEDELKECVINKVKAQNCVPDTAKKKYKEALFEYYRLFTGELKKRVEEPGLKIAEAGPSLLFVGCPGPHY